MLPSNRPGVYLETVSLEDALARTWEALSAEETPLAVESLDSRDAAGRVLAHAVAAAHSAPNVHCAAMDGVAVEARRTFAAREGQPVLLRRGVDYLPINTGQPLPHTPAAPFNADAVVMVEHVRFLQEEGEEVAAIEEPVFPWRHVRRMGEDMVATELLFPRNHVITPWDVGALLTAGVWEVPVWEQPRLVVIPTGDEILDADDRPTPGPGQVVESNSAMLVAMAAQAGLAARRVKPVQDDPDAIAAAVRQALDDGAHVVATCAGSSAGSKDYTRSVFEALGEVRVHGVSAMPGKPALLAVADARSPRPGALLAGAPGYPVSAAVVMEELIIPLAARLGHIPTAPRPQAEAVLSRRSPSKPGLTEFLRLCVGEVGDRLVAAPLSRGAGNITTLSRAQALTRIPPQCEGVEAGETVTIELLTPRETLADVLLVVGSHDATLDLLADRLMAQRDTQRHPVRLVSNHVGSLGGLTALKEGMALMAGAHLFDPESGDFNFPFITRYTPDLDLLVVNLAIRHQGLITAPGNPKGLQGVADLARGDVRFVNRQRGAGTRILLDHHLKLAGVKPSAVNGYGKEEHTHTAVALNVAMGEADCGLGVMAAARALALDFVPLARERYDLLIPAAHAEDPRVQALLALLEDDETQRAIVAQGGYETALTGQRMSPGEGLGR